MGVSEFRKLILKGLPFTPFFDEEIIHIRGNSANQYGEPACVPEQNRERGAPFREEFLFKDMLWL